MPGEVDRLLDRLRRVVVERQITQAELARELNIEPSALSRWLSGKARPDVVSLLRLASRLGYSDEQQQALAEDRMGERIRTADRVHELEQRLNTALEAIDRLEGDYKDLLDRLPPANRPAPRAVRRR